MKAIKQAFSIYIHGSIHVGFAVLALVLMTNHMFGLPFSPAMAGFAFFGTVFGYNFIKYEAHLRLRKPITRYTAAIAAISLVALLAGAVCFFLLSFRAQLTAVLFAVFAILYAVPVFAKGKNLRSLAGIKIYIVALCWAGVSTLMPLVNGGLDLGHDAWLKFCQRFLLTIILILIFEIIDISVDDPGLKTVPQKIGVGNTKLLNICLLVLFYGLEFLKTYVDVHQAIANIVLVVAVMLFTVFANPHRNKYYTLFWVESVPIFWLGLLLLLDRLAL